MSRTNRWKSFLLIFIFIAHSSGIPKVKPYQFAYIVNDTLSGNDFGHMESSDGEIVHGQYHVLLPDGRKQTVTYTADTLNGYQAHVTYTHQSHKAPVSSANEESDDCPWSSPIYRCDGVEDCSDGSDERNCYIDDAIPEGPRISNDNHLDDIIIGNDSKSLTFVELRDIAQQLTDEVDNNISNRMFVCSLVIRNRYQECQRRCRTPFCLLQEVKNYWAACFRGTRQTCITPTPRSSSSIQDGHGISNDLHLDDITKEELENITENLTNEQEPKRYRQFGGCSRNVDSFKKCKSSCRNLFCLLIEMRNLWLGCLSGLTQTCSCQCGLVNTLTPVPTGETNSVGTEVTPRRRYPWQVAFIVTNLPTPAPNAATPMVMVWCGGTIINNRWIITAANCERDPDDLVVRVGEHNLASTMDNDNSNTQSYNIERFVRGPNGADIALVELKVDIQINNIIKPVCLPENDSKTYSGETGKVTGWGTIDSTKIGATPATLFSLPNALRESNFIIDDRQIDCKELEICARASATTDSCSGDKGGPIMVKEGNKYILVGTAIRGPQSCTRAGTGATIAQNDAIYTRISKFLVWIRKTAGRDCS